MSTAIIEGGATCLTGCEQAHLGGDLVNGFYLKPTVFVGHNKMRIFQEEIFGPVLSVTKFKTIEEELEIAKSRQTKNLLVSSSSKALGFF